MFGIGGTEAFLIAFFALLIFGPDKLPKMARTVGRWYGEFKRAQETMQAQIKVEMAELERAAGVEPKTKGDEDPDKPQRKSLIWDTPDTNEPAAKSVVTDVADWDEEEEEEE